MAAATLLSNPNTTSAPPGPTRARSATRRRSASPDGLVGRFQPCVSRPQPVGVFRRSSPLLREGPALLPKSPRFLPEPIGVGFQPDRVNVHRRPFDKVERATSSAFANVHDDLDLLSVLDRRGWQGGPRMDGALRDFPSGGRGRRGLRSLNPP
jgi:hypothetical protein